MTRPIHVWLNSPPFVELGPLRELAEFWPESITIHTLSPSRQERSRLGWEEVEFGRLLHVAHNVDDVQYANSLEPLIESESIHLIGGFSGASGRVLQRLALSKPRRDNIIIVMTERPGIYGPHIKRLSRQFGLHLKYWLLGRFYQKRIDLLLPLGDAGIRYFHSTGWPEAGMLPYIYCPPLAPATRPVSYEADQTSKLKMLYLGRSCFTTKGTDILMSAFDGLDSKQFQLDIVGDYGPDRQAVKDWASVTPGANVFSGVRTSDAISLIRNYDVVLVPSRFDGWNVTVNLAVLAGVGVITTEAAVSDELIRFSGAGVVLADLSSGGLRTALENMTETEVRRWKENAWHYAASISPATVAGYLNEVLDFAQGNVLDRPVRPWLVP